MLENPRDREGPMGPRGGPAHGIPELDATAGTAPIAGQTRREFLRRMGLAGLAASAAGLPAACVSFGRGGPSRRPPNVVLVFTDDQGYGDVGVYGARGFSTPHLDRLASEGMRLTDFYASQAVCSASRASLLTGCYAERISIQGALSPGAEIGLNPQEETIAEILRREGYATAIFGKWHLGDHPEFLPLRHGFDEYLGIPYSNDMWPIGYDGRLATEGAKANHPFLPLVEGDQVVERLDEPSDQDRLTTLYTQRAVRFIDEHAAEPFFLYLAHSMPHVPLGVSERYRGSSEQGKYGDVIQEIDWSVGQVLEALDRNGLNRDTLVIFTSDNGPWLNFGNHAGSTGGLREGKGTAFEGGPRVPAIFRWPGRIEAGSIFGGMASTLDILPTLAAIVGAKLPERPIDGVSLASVLEGETDTSPRNVFFYYYMGELRAVREGKWKRVYEHRTRSYEGVEPGRDGLPGSYAFPVVPAALYDLEADPAETTDLSPRYRQVVDRLDALAEDAREALGDRLTGRRGSEVRPPGRLRFERPELVEHQAVGASVTLVHPPDPRYPGDGPKTLTDGVMGTRDHGDFRWLGFSGTDLLATVDLGSPREVNRIGLGCLQAQTPWIFLPWWVEFSVSEDGKAWMPAGRIEVPLEKQATARAVRLEVEVAAVSREETVDQRRLAGPFRFVRVHARNRGSLPEWHPGAPEPAWLFVDEIVVE